MPPAFYSKYTHLQLPPKPRRPPLLSLSSVTRTHNTPRTHTQARQRQGVLPESEARTAELRCASTAVTVAESPLHPPARPSIPPCTGCLSLLRSSPWMLDGSLSAQGAQREKTPHPGLAFCGFLVRLDATERVDHTPSASSSNSQPLAC